MPPSLEELKERVDVARVTWCGGHGEDGLILGLEDLRVIPNLNDSESVMRRWRDCRMAEVGMDLWRSSCEHLCSKQHQPELVSQDHCSGHILSVFNISKDRDLTTFLGSLLSAEPLLQ